MPPDDDAERAREPDAPVPPWVVVVATVRLPDAPRGPRVRVRWWADGARQERAVPRKAAERADALRGRADPEEEAVRLLHPDADALAETTPRGGARRWRVTLRHGSTWDPGGVQPAALARTARSRLLYGREPNEPPGASS